MMDEIKSLTGKQRIYTVFQHKTADRIPWVPFAGIHAGKLKDYTSKEILTQPSKLLECLLEVHRLYTPDGQPVVFDLQVEAEILGCELRWSEKSPPSVVSHPLSEILDIPTQLPKATDGRLPDILQVMRDLKQAVGDTTALFGLITGPLTLASHLRGTNIFLDLIQRKDYTKKLLEYCTHVAIALVDLYIDAGMDVIAIVDPVVSQVSPRMFKSFLQVPFKTIFDHIRSHNALSSFFVCGDATKNIEPMCHTQPDSIFVDENIDMTTAKKITDSFNIVLGGNIPLTTTMLFGTQQDNMRYTIDLLDKLSPTNLIIAPGCDMPYDVPLENVIGVIEAINDPDAVRKALETYESVELDLDAVLLPDYPNLLKPLIEVFTLDSDQCAACTYMKGLAFSAIDKFGDKIDIVEYKWTFLENIARTKKMGIKHLPCIYINGELKWSSIIPDQIEYYTEIQKYL